MKNSQIGHPIIHLESVDSTNNYAAKVFKSDQVPPGAVILSDIQTDGRGQRHKTWHSDAYLNLTFSITGAINLWKINSLIDLNRIVAIALQRFFLKFDPSARIKWPNDIMVRDQKICGILLENFFRQRKPLSVIGIGINVNQKKFNAPRATSIALLTGSDHINKEILHTFLHSLNQTIKTFSSESSQSIHLTYDELLWKKDDLHTFTLNEGVKETGRIQSTTSDGNLVVFMEGEHITFRNSEISY